MQRLLDMELRIETGDREYIFSEKVENEEFGSDRKG